MNNPSFASNYFLFSLLYEHLLQEANELSSALHIANHYKEKAFHKAYKKCNNKIFDSGSNYNAILLLIKHESLKSLTASGILLGLSFLPKIQGKNLSGIINTISLYYLRLRMLMGIALLCKLDLRDESVARQLLELMSSVSLLSSSWMSKSSRSIKSKNKKVFTIGKSTLSLSPWLLSLTILSKTVIDGIVTYKLGKRACNKFGYPNIT